MPARMTSLTGFDYLSQRMHYVIGYSITPNSAHVFIAISNSGKNITPFLLNGERFMAYELVDMLKHQNKTIIPDELSKALNNTEKKLNKLHIIFEISFVVKECSTMKFT